MVMVAGSVALLLAGRPRQSWPPRNAAICSVNVANACSLAARARSRACISAGVLARWNRPITSRRRGSERGLQEPSCRLGVCRPRAGGAACAAAPRRRRSGRRAAAAGQPAPPGRPAPGSVDGAPARAPAARGLCRRGHRARPEARAAVARPVERTAAGAVVAGVLGLTRPAPRTSPVSGSGNPSLAICGAVRDPAASVSPAAAAVSCSSMSGVRRTGGGLLVGGAGRVVGGRRQRAVRAVGGQLPAGVDVVLPASAGLRVEHAVGCVLPVAGRAGRHGGSVDVLAGSCRRPVQEGSDPAHRLGRSGS